MIRDKLKQDSVVALKAHDSKRVGVLRFLISLIDKKEMLLPPGTMGDGEVVGVLRKELKNKEESKEMFLKAGRMDLVEEQDYEIVVVKEYLPAEMSEEKIREIVESCVGTGQCPVRTFGEIMREVMVKTGGTVGGDVISRIVKEILQSRI